MVKLIHRFTEFEVSPTLGINESVAKHRAEGREVLHLGFGQSPFPVHPRLEAALKNAVTLNKYTPVSGVPELCETVLEFYASKLGFNPDDYDVMIAPGSKLILYALQMAIDGDLLMPVPSWVSYTPQAQMLGRLVIKIPTRLDDGGYHLDSDSLRQAIHDARAAGKNPTKLILNYPNNPTGLTIPKSELKDIAKTCAAENIVIISDEIYGMVSFDHEYASILPEAPEHSVISSGLAKHLSLGGWRIGIGIIPKKLSGLFAMMKTIASETWSCVPTPIQHAAIEAYKGHDDLEEFIKDCADIHGLMNIYIAQKLQDLDVHCPMPQGAFYSYPDFAAHKDDLQKRGIVTSYDLADYLINNHAIASLPGVAFGADPEVLSLRLSACDYDGQKALSAYQDGQDLNEEFINEHAPNIKMAAQRFEAFIKGHE